MNTQTTVTPTFRVSLHATQDTLVAAQHGPELGTGAVVHVNIGDSRHIGNIHLYGDRAEVCVVLAKALEAARTAGVPS